MKIPTILYQIRRKGLFKLKKEKRYVAVVLKKQILPKFFCEAKQEGIWKELETGNEMDIKTIDTSVYDILELPELYVPRFKEEWKKTESKIIILAYLSGIIYTKGSNSKDIYSIVVYMPKTDFFSIEISIILIENNCPWNIFFHVPSDLVGINLNLYEEIYLGEFSILRPNSILFHGRGYTEGLIIEYVKEKLRENKIC